MHAVEFNQVSKRFRRTVIADNMDMQIRERSFSLIFGPPASGKSTLLRLITGLETPDSGKICLRGEDVTGVSPGDRNIGYVPQSFALYPHYSVFDNIAYPLKLMGVSKADYTPIVRETAAQLQIEDLLPKRPDQCSGGEKQRVAIARGIVKNTKIFILDDPLTGLDFKLREQLFDDLRQMQTDLEATFIYTTSDPLEALMLAEDVHVFDGGKIIEVGNLEDIYHEPHHARSVELLGYPQTNMIPSELKTNGKGQVCESDFFSFPVATVGDVDDMPVQVAIRPQDIMLDPQNLDGVVTSPAEITLVEDLGGELHIYLHAAGTELETVLPHRAGQEPTEGPATIGIRPDRCRLYSASSNQFIGSGVVQDGN